MDARGSKLPSCKIPDQYLKKQKVIKLLELWQLWLMKKRKEKNCEYNSVVITTLKKKETHCIH